MDADELMMAALDAGAEDFDRGGRQLRDSSQHPRISRGAVREALEAAGIKMAQAEVTMLPQNYVTLTSDEDIKQMNRILDLLDDDDDVQEVWHNWEE